MNAVSSKISDLEVEAARKDRLFYIRQSSSLLDPDPVEIAVHDTQIPWLIDKLTRAISAPHSAIRNPKSRRPPCRSR